MSLILFNTYSNITYPCGWLGATGGRSYFANRDNYLDQVTRHIATSSIDLTTHLHLSHRVNRWKAISKLVFKGGMVGFCILYSI